MRLTLRLWIALLAAVVLVLAAGLVVRLQAEESLLVEVTLRDRRFFAHALQTALARPGSNGSPLEEAERLLGREEIASGHIAARLILPEQRASLGLSQLVRARSPELGRGEVVVLADGDQILTYIPLGGGEALLELREPHALGDVLARLGWRSLLVQLLVLAALAGLASFMLVRWLVGEPVSKLVRLTRRFADGDLKARAELPERGDEVAELGRELHHMADQLLAVRHTLDEVDGERVEALEALRHADRLRTVGQLASSLAHELGTPLNVVSGHARMILEEGGLSAELRASTRTILEQVARMSGLIRELLGFVRRKSQQRGEVDLHDLARSAARTLEPLMRRHEVEVELRCAPEELRIAADGQELLQVLTNLVMNAAQSMPQGGRVRVGLAEREAAPPTGVHASAGRCAVIEVADEGQGIAAEDLPHLFEPFFTQRREGTGLGLAVVHGIVRDHGGWVVVASEPGRGTRFEVYLPLARGAGLETERPPD
jgi:two-component system, NtrC family, sensor kinase